MRDHSSKSLYGLFFRKSKNQGIAGARFFLQTGCPFCPSNSVKAKIKDCNCKLHMAFTMSLAVLWRTYLQVSVGSRGS